MPGQDHLEPFDLPLQAVQNLITALGGRGIVIGGVAASLLGEPRFTQDLDAMILLSVEDIPNVIALAQKYGLASRISEIEEFAKRNRVLLFQHSESATDVDITMGLLPFEEEMIARSVLHQINPSFSIQLPTPEDLIIMKAIAHRPKDMLDIQGIIDRNPQLDTKRIQEWVTQFGELLERPELWEDIADWF
jgi:hypothetical protein